MFVRRLLFLTVVSTFAFSGCVNTSGDLARPEPRPLGQEFGAFEAPGKPPTTVQHAPEVAEPNGVITLRQALSLALMHNPELKAFSWDVRAAEANQMQAALLPNPELEVEVEEFGGTGARHGFNSSEASIQVGQFIELAQKRSKRIHLATLEKQLAHWDYRTKRLDVISRVAAAFVDVLAVQEKLALSREMVRLTEQTHSAVAQRVSAGKDSPLKETKAKVALSTMQIQSQRAAQALKSARTRLAATWGASNAAFDAVTGQFYEVPPVPEPNDLMDRVWQNPDIARWAIERQKYRAAFDLEKAKATSDMTIKGGLAQLNEGDDTTFIVGLAIPIPMFDRNQAGIRRATYAIEKAAEQQRAAEIHIQSALSQAAQSLATAFAEATILAKDVVPGAQSAFDAATLGYQAGKFDYLDVLDAQRTLFEAKGQYVRSLAEYHKARADVERLIAQSLDSIDDTQENNK